MDQLTVLHIFSGDLWAGAEVMIFNLLSTLKENPDLGIAALSLNEGILCNKLREHGIEPHVVPESTTSLAGIYVKSLGLFKKKKIDIIHSHRYKENLLAALLAKSLGVKKLYSTVHGLPEPRSWDKHNGGKPLKLKTKINYYLLNSYFTRVVAVSYEMKNSLIRQGVINKEKIDVIYNGIPVPPAGPSPYASSDDKVFHIGTVGRMVPVKDHNLFLETAAEIRKRSDEVRFSILGDGPLKEQLVRRAKDLEIGDRVEFLPPRPDPFPYYESLDLYLNTSHHEGIPLSILEAMACGKIVVAPRVGGITEIIVHGKNGFLVDAREPAAIANLCISLMKDKGSVMAVGRDAVDRVASCFSKEKMAASYLDLYRSGK